MSPSPSTAPLRLVKSNDLSRYNRQIQDLAEAVGGVEDLMALQADALPDGEDRYLPVFRGAMQMLRLIRQELSDVGLDIAEAEAGGAQ